MLDKFIDLLISLFNEIKPIVFVLEFDKGRMFRAGRFLKILEPGWHFRIPFVDTVFIENVVNTTLCVREVNITTADGISASIAAKFNLEIVDLYKSSVLTNDWKVNIVDVSRGIISKRSAKYTWDDIYKGNADEEVRSLVEAEAGKIGLRIWNFEFTDKLNIFGLKVFNS